MDLLKAGLVLALAGCAFDPTLVDRYRCGPGGECPPGLTCAADEVCRGTATDLGASPTAPPGTVAAPDLAGTAAHHADLSAQDLAEPSRDLPHPSDLASPPDLATPADLAHAADLASPICTPRMHCKPDECGPVPDGCGGVLDCKKCKPDD